MKIAKISIGSIIILTFCSISFAEAKQDPWEHYFKLVKNRRTKRKAKAYFRSLSGKDMLKCSVGLFKYMDKRNISITEGGAHALFWMLYEYIKKYGYDIDAFESVLKDKQTPDTWRICFFMSKKLIKWKPGKIRERYLDIALEYSLNSNTIYLVRRKAIERAIWIIGYQFVDVLEQNAKSLFKKIKKSDQTTPLLVWLKGRKGINSELQGVKADLIRLDKFITALVADFADGKEKAILVYPAMYEICEALGRNNLLDVSKIKESLASVVTDAKRTPDSRAVAAICLRELDGKNLTPEATHSLSKGITDGKLKWRLKRKVDISITLWQSRVLRYAKRNNTTPKPTTKPVGNRS